MGAFRRKTHLFHGTMKALKALRFPYVSSCELSTLFEDFRLMVNDAIRLAFRFEKGHPGKKVRNRFALIELAYPRLREYGLHTHYILNACEVAFSVYKNRKTTNPYIRRAFLKLDAQAYKLDYLLLRIPTAPRRFIYLTLSGSPYHRSIMADRTLKRGSVTITPSHVVVAFSKEKSIAEPRGNIGIDVNERNVTWTDSAQETGREDTSKIAELKARYQEIRAKIATRTRKDRRVGQELLSKYGRRERDRTIQILNLVSKRIVERAKEHGYRIVMERLKGIRKLYRKGNGQGSRYRGRMNSWMFREFQRQVDYKAAWLGVPVTYVSPRFTSRKCPECGSPLKRLKGRMLWCPSCNQTGDRDVIASRNIMMACAVPQALPSA